ncbi:hypothetical protein ROZALSC1DRAFT_26550 [Rozella allomycis CSF55]|uniref:Major facilitator superfamily associated domain-containing protein n=1 Tax=Rozella allomycis (strain CSF55) TaxID=988480 RepID=A0A075B4S3_ROZAC|nr:hypothetical protein O9G_005432 [Rozella allomycis CSF55]RKP22077.1 hypothetical protein ROZALSC1DRAFT_26550 [Rozella allomycis CSF55]|eukprot:EPZ36434.1 hypothetical protein O9G_005432 [Rozella allomycis CSF55]
MNLAYFSCYTFRPKYLNQRYGIDTKDYGIIAALLSLVSFFAAYTWSYLTDRLGRPKVTLIVTVLVSAALFQLMLIDINGKTETMMWASTVSGFYVFFVSAIIPVLDARMLKWLMEIPGGSKELYGRQRLWGTVNCVWHDFTWSIEYSPFPDH